MGEHWEKQPRDEEGRWASKGANKLLTIVKNNREKIIEKAIVSGAGVAGTVAGGPAVGLGTKLAAHTGVLVAKKAHDNYRKELSEGIHSNMVEFAKAVGAKTLKDLRSQEFGEELERELQADVVGALVSGAVGGMIDIPMAGTPAAIASTGKIVQGSLALKRLIRHGMGAAT